MRLVAFLLFFLLPGLSKAQIAPNYDESKVPAFVLPDLLTSSDGKKINSVKDWESIRQPELLQLFAREVYGISPDEKIKLGFRLLKEDKNALGGMAHCKQIEFVFSGNKQSVKAILLLYLPKNRKGKVPVFIGYNFLGNTTVNPDPQIIPSPAMVLNLRPNKDKSPGSDQHRWPLELILNSGFGVATMYYNDIYPDDATMAGKSILPLFSTYEKTGDKPEAWQAIGAWAWGLSRIADFLATESSVDQQKLIVIGHSRQGKASLWAGAQDRRFSMVVSNNAGCGGAALSNRKFGETISVINTSFPHWFCRNFRQYNDREETLPLDQHALVALLAPRPVYIASASSDLWADPTGELLSGYHASPVYALY